MSDILTQSTPRTDADYEAEVQKLLDEMRLLEEKMENHRAESERIKLETQVITRGTDAKLARLEEQVRNLSKAR